MTQAPARKVTEVAVGVLIRPDGLVLLADRPPGKPYAGYWEFPGGKIEAGESVAVALHRELHEELGIAIDTSLPWVTFEHDYPHAYVRLHFERVYGWEGVPHPRECQHLGFFRPGRDVPAPLLPAAVPALRWLQLPDVLAIDDGESALGRILAVEQLRGAKTRPPGEWLGAFADSRADIEHAAALSCDFAVIGLEHVTTHSKTDTALDWAAVASLTHAAPLPIFVFGGIDPGDLAIARRHGAHGIAQLLTRA